MKLAAPAAAVLLAATFTILVHSADQDDPPKREVKRKAHSKFIEASAAKIKKLNPKVAKTVDKDAHIVASLLSFDKFAKLMEEKGFPKEEDRRMAVYSAWRILRVGPKPLPVDQVITQKELETLVADFGKVVLESLPVAAGVMFDNQPWDPTNTALWASPGKHSVQYDKDGFEPVDEMVEVKRSAVTKFRKELKPKKK